MPKKIQTLPSPSGDVMQLLPSLALNVHGGIRRGVWYGAGFFLLFGSVAGVYSAGLVNVL